MHVKRIMKPRVNKESGSNQIMSKAASTISMNTPVNSTSLVMLTERMEQKGVSA